MSWLSILLMVVSNIPEIIKAAVAIIALIKGIRDKHAAKAELVHLRNNVETARRSKDFAGLEQQLARLKAQCKACEDV